MATYYWAPAAGSSTGTWDATNAVNWAATSGGVPTGLLFPLVTDNVVFDANSVNGGSFTVTHSTGATCANFDASGVDQAMTLTGTTTWTVTGNLTTPATNFTKLGTGTLTFSGSAAKAINTNGVSYACSVTFNAASSSMTLGGNLVIATGRTISFTNGTLNLAGYNVTCGTFTSSGSAARTLTLSTGTVTCNDASTSWALGGATNLTLSAASSTILMASASAKTFAGNGYTYGVVKSAGAGAMTISGNNTFGELGNTVQPTTIRLTAGSTQTVTTFSASGTSGNVVTLDSSSAGTAATLSKASGTVNASYMSIKDSAATGGATWNALNSTDVSGNSGWVFTTPPAVAGGNFLMVF